MMLDRTIFVGSPTWGRAAASAGPPHACSISIYPFERRAPLTRDLFHLPAPPQSLSRVGPAIRGSASPCPVPVGTPLPPDEERDLHAAKRLGIGARIRVGGPHQFGHHHLTSRRAQ